MVQSGLLFGNIPMLLSAHQSETQAWDISDATPKDPRAPTANSEWAKRGAPLANREAATLLGLFYEETAQKPTTNHLMLTPDQSTPTYRRGGASPRRKGPSLISGGFVHQTVFCFFCGGGGCHRPFLALPWDPPPSAHRHASRAGPSYLPATGALEAAEAVRSPDQLHLSTPRCVV